MRVSQIAPFRFGRRIYDLSARTYVMGVLNVTPDSFSDGGLWMDVDKAVSHAKAFIDEGADFIDVGGESSRPGSTPVPADEEIRRVLPVIRRLAEITDVPISIDTYKASVADKALASGAVIVNDISGFRSDRGMAAVVASYGASAILMHMKGTPESMQDNPLYENLIGEICDSLDASIQMARNSGVQQILIDPGIGFGKMVSHNLQILRELGGFKRFGLPIVIGPSRKSFLGKILGTTVMDRLEGTAAAVAVAIMNGANVVRVHDVREMKRVALVVDAIAGKEQSWNP